MFNLRMYRSFFHIGGSKLSMKLLPERESNTLIVLSVGLCVCVYGGGGGGHLGLE